LIIKKIDINSIFPIIIKIIKLNLDDVSKLAKFIFSSPNIADVVVFVIVKIDNLKDFSKSILSRIRIPDKINKLKKKDIKIKKEILIFSLVIFFSELNIFLFITLLGLISLIISEEAVFVRIYILVNLIPDVFEIKEPPIAAIKIKYKPKLLSEFISVIPELDRLLKTLIIIFKPL
tara:strand:- start:27 stop:554 length:528 start_codon:yes stop_codon:yes gene_type:complete